MSEGTLVPLGALLPVLAERAGGGAAVIVDDVVLTAPALAAEVATVAARFADAGVTVGDRVVLAMPNGIDFIEAFLAVQALGAVVVPVNLRYHPQEVARLVRHAGARHVVAEGDHATQLVTEAGVDRILTVGDRVESTGPLPVHHAAPADVAVILYTSGTTSAPKGCLLTHEALIRTSVARIEERRLADPEVVWAPSPLFHVGALVPLLSCLNTGSTFLTTVQFDGPAALRQLREHRVTTALPLFPPFTDALLDAAGNAGVDGVDLPDLRQILTTGIPHAVERALEAFAPAKLVSAYGMTELCGPMATSPIDEADADRLRYDGTPFAGLEVRTVDPETGTPQAAGAGVVGELSVRGWCCCAGYLDDPEATAAAFDADGWFRTGDMGEVDELGRIRFLGRYKDMLKVGGENVGAAEVEKVVGRHPAVRHVEVVGVPDERYGEVVGAFVELEPNGHGTVTADELIEHCNGQIARFKVPRQIWFMAADEWPRSATKVDKNALRKLVLV